MSSPQQMAPDPEEILHNAVDRGEPLEMSDRLEATHLAFTLSGAGNPRKWLKRSGEPPRNRTGNLQIKSLLLCQLS